MADPEPTPAPPTGQDAKIREEWRKLEQQRIDEEIAEARENAQAATGGRRPGWLVWVAFGLALAAGIAVTVLLNRGGGGRP